MDVGEGRRGFVGGGALVKGGFEQEMDLWNPSMAIGDL